MEVSAMWIRGGTSKCWVFDGGELDALGVPVDQLLVRLFGSPDERQLDGVGGGTSTTSKAIIARPSERDGVDVDFTFAQVGIDEGKVDWGSNCGNCSATVALYAVERGWTTPTADETTIITHNDNTGQIIEQVVETPAAALPVSLSATQPGVVFPGVRVDLGFRDPAGRTTGALLPTGQTREVISVNGQDVDVTMIDAGAPCVFIDASSFGLGDVDFEDWADRMDERAGALDSIRREAAVRMGMALTADKAERAVPKVGVVRPGREAVEVVMMSMGRSHPAMPITGSIALSLAARHEGTVAAGDEHAEPRPSLPIRTRAGVIHTSYSEHAGSGRVSVARTARVLARASLPAPPMNDAGNAGNGLRGALS